MVWATLDSVRPWPLYYHSPCVNTQATYSKAKPIAIIVNADVIVCVFNSMCRAGGRCLVNGYSVRLPHNVVQDRRPDVGALMPAMWLLHKDYQTRPPGCGGDQLGAPALTTGLR